MFFFLKLNDYVFLGISWVKPIGLGFREGLWEGVRFKFMANNHRLLKRSVNNDAKR